MRLRKRYFILAFLIAGLVALYFSLKGAILVQTGTLDPATVTVGQTHFDDVTEVHLSLLPRPYRLRMEEADYEPLERWIWVAPWEKKVIALRPKLKEEGRGRHEVRAAASQIIEAAGTYDSEKGFEAYLEKLKSLTTEALYKDLQENPAYLKGRAYDLSVGAKGSTSVSDTEIESLKENEAVVVATAVTKITTKEGRVTIRKKYTLTLQREGEAWKAAALREETVK
jgi:hypothetical protein